MAPYTYSMQANILYPIHSHRSLIMDLLLFEFCSLSRKSFFLQCKTDYSMKSSYWYDPRVIKTFVHITDIKNVLFLFIYAELTLGLTQFLRKFVNWTGTSTNHSCGTWLPLLAIQPEQRNWCRVCMSRSDPSQHYWISELVEHSLDDEPFNFRTFRCYVVKVHAHNWCC